VARELRRDGWPRARALVGGWVAWREAGLPFEGDPPAEAARLVERPAGREGE
jgi:3-mercaptopyruvate sulfurtransferase SseA